MQVHLIEVITTQYLTPNILELRVKPVKPKTFKFKPGQFVFFDIGGAWKAYSMASVPDPKMGIRFLIKLEPKGRGSGFVKNAKPGDRFEFSGPEGEFIVRSKTKPLYCIAAGVGIAPFLSIIPSLLPKTQSSVTLLYGASTKQNLVCEGELWALAKKYKNFKFIPVVGRLPQYIRQYAKMEKNTLWYVCGKSEAVSAIEKAVAERVGQQGSVVTEVFLQ